MCNIENKERSFADDMDMVFSNLPDREKLSKLKVSPHDSMRSNELTDDERNKLLELLKDK